MYVLVVKASGSTTHFMECVADVLAPDELTVTCTDVPFSNEHGPMQVFAPGTWREATVFRDNGFPDYNFQSTAYRAVLAARAKPALTDKGTDEHDRVRKTTSAA